MVRNYRVNFEKSGSKEIVNWVTNSWGKITDSDVFNALRAGYLDISQDMKDCQENQNITQSFIYDDVPEESSISIYSN